MLWVALAFVAVARAAGECDPLVTSTACDSSYCTNAFLLQRFCQYNGIPATLLGFEPSDTWSPRLEEFNRCTGARVSITYNGADGQGDEEAMPTDLQADIGVNYTVANGEFTFKEGAGIFDGYITQPPWLSEILTGLENLSPLISENMNDIRWLDVNAASRNAVSYGSAVYALPLDIDYVSIGWRQDVFEQHNITAPPATIEELVEMAEYFYGQDHNADGVPDYGICITNQQNYFYVFMAPFLQSRTHECTAPGACEGEPTGDNMFFDVRTFEPMFANPAFRRAVDLYDRVLRASNCRGQPGFPVSCNRQRDFRAGRCALLVSMPSTMTALLQSVGNATWVPKTQDGSHYGRRGVFPGSEEVLDRAANTLVRCRDRPDLCPEAFERPPAFNRPADAAQRLVNYAPYMAEGGESYSLRASAPDRKKQLLFDLFSWFSTLNPTDVPLTGIYRESQLGTAKIQAINPTWPAPMASDLNEVLTFIFQEDLTARGNAVKDLLIPGFGDYMAAINTIVFRQFLLAPGYHREFTSNATARDAAFAARFPAFVANLTAAYAAATDKYGHLEQLTRWRAALNLPVIPYRDLCLAPAAQASARMQHACAPYHFVAAGAAGSTAGTTASDTNVTVGLAVGLPLAALIILLAVVVATRRRRRQQESLKEVAHLVQRVRSALLKGVLASSGRSSGTLEAELDARLASLELPDSAELTLGRELGRGQFGLVCEGSLKLPGSTDRIRVAAKRLAAAADADGCEALLYEAHLQALLSGHPHVLALLALRTTSLPLLIVSEFMAGGDLLTYLRTNGRTAALAPSPRALLAAARNIADAMVHLGRHRVVHRDLAARNVLVGANVADVRLADFGMSRQLVRSKEYYRRAGHGADDVVPIKWMPLEAIRFRTFTVHSDAWSYGVLLWELFSLGETPFAALSPVETVVAVASGTRLTRPSSCPESVYTHVLLPCWAAAPEARPAFDALVAVLDGFAAGASDEPITQVAPLSPAAVAEALRGTPAPSGASTVGGNAAGAGAAGSGYVTGFGAPRSLASTSGGGMAGYSVFNAADGLFHPASNAGTVVSVSGGGLAAVPSRRRSSSEAMSDDPVQPANKTPVHGGGGAASTTVAGSSASPPRAFAGDAVLVPIPPLTTAEGAESESSPSGDVASPVSPASSHGGRRSLIATVSEV